MTERAPQQAAIQLLIPRAALQARIAELGADLAARYRLAPSPPLLVGVLKGSAMFLSDLARATPIDVTVDFIAISSYADMPGASPVVRFLKDMDEDVAGRDVVLVEDMVDTGLSLNYLRASLAQRSPRSLAALSLLDKPARRIVPVQLEQRGFEIPDLFVVGYGLDVEGRYRNLPEIFAVRDLQLLRADPLAVSRYLYGRG